MKKVLVIYFSQSGQLKRVIDSMLAPLIDSENFKVTFEVLAPQKRYPFPWPFFQFFNTFPETVYEDCEPLAPLKTPTDQQFDLVILAYQVWFLSPSLPITAFLNSDAAKQLLNDTPVITVIGCRNMWLMAQEKVKQKLIALNARLIDNVVLTDSAHSAATFISTPVWVLTGNKGPFLNGLIPKAGISEQDIAGCARFGKRIAQQFPDRAPNDNSPMLEGLGAVKINERLISSEKVALRSFKIWGKLLRSLGKPSSMPRKTVLILYIIFLVTLILTVVPLLAIIKRIISPFTQQKVAEERVYFAAPSGEGVERMEQ